MNRTSVPIGIKKGDGLVDHVRGIIEIELKPLTPGVAHECPMLCSRCLHGFDSLPEGALVVIENRPWCPRCMWNRVKGWCLR